MSREGRGRKARGGPSGRNLGLGDAFNKAEEEFLCSKQEEWQQVRGKGHGNRKQRPDGNRNTDCSSTERIGSTDRGRGYGGPLQNRNSQYERHSQSSCERTDFSHQPSQGSSDRQQPKRRDEGREESSRKKSKDAPQKEERHEKNNFSYRNLELLAAKDNTDIIRILANSHSGLEEFLNGDIRPDFMYFIIKILSKVMQSDWEENKLHIVMKCSTPDFFKKVREFLNDLVTEEQSTRRRNEMEQFFDNLITFFHGVTICLPSVAADHLKGPLIVLKMVLDNITTYQNITINPNLLERNKQLMFDFEERKKEKEEREKVLVVKESIDIYPKPMGHIGTVPLYPQPEDIDRVKTSVVPNKINGPYNNVDHYLDVQFRLLREDFVSPLRTGINEYRNKNSDKGQNKKKVNYLRMYFRVKFIKPIVIGDKVGYDICFDREKRLKGVKWEYSKRFIFGSLLLFTEDNFHTFFLATVVKRDVTVLEKNRIISVVLCDTNKLAQDILSKEFTMAESEVYFEPYYNVLKALQKFNSDSFPMKKYIVYVEKKPGRPAYTRNGSDVYTISAENGIRKTIRLFDPQTWPTSQELGFDSSQMDAFRAALTQDLAVIQGPPGTGKTFLGLKIAAVLLENSAIWNFDHKTPILVICYTNHALDQFLEGILRKELTNNIVRIGGRSKSEVLEPFNLRERRTAVAYYCPNRDQAMLLKDLKQEMSEIFESIKILQNNLEHLEKLDGILSLKTLRIVISDHHREFFRNNDDLLHWLIQGAAHNVKWNKTLIATSDKKAERIGSGIEKNVQYDMSDFENFRRLREVLFDYLDLEEPESSTDSNKNLRMYYTCTIDEIHKRLEELSAIIDCSVDLEEKPEVIREAQRKIREAKEIQTNLKLILDYVMDRLQNTNPPSDEDAQRLPRVENLNSLNMEQRWALYKTWIEFLKSGYWMMICKLEERYRRGARRYDETRQYDDLKIVQQADVVGITTTTAARLQAMLRELRPKIVIVEEAAEVLEAHIVASLSSYCQHLILIGDHKQLRPSPADYRLGKDYHLDISLFERFVNNGVSYHTLRTQHRMRPEISNLLVPTIYDSLNDHESTMNRPRVRGMDNNMYFMTHKHFEEEVDDIMSKKNMFEAQLVMRLARYLLLQGYGPEEITVLTTYSGQMFLMKEEQKRLEISKDLLITPVDNYQGEENKIILLSLVRSNADGRTGFLKMENRVCVALSRARDGLFVVGNMDCLSADTNGVLWQRIRQKFTDQNAFGPAFVLRCETHRNQITRILTPSDFNQVLEGGCNKPCGERLPCGHLCRSVCHVAKDRHQLYTCSEPCNRVCAEGHACGRKCFEKCKQCKLPVVRPLSCGHRITLPCHQEYSKMQCKQEVVLRFPECGHEVKVQCCQRGVKTCPKPCEFRLECGHACTRMCHLTDDPDHLDYVCPKPCAQKPRECRENPGHACPLACFEPCQPCEVNVIKHLPCGHTQPALCRETQLICKVPCQRTLACGHPCPRKCYEECGGCKVKVEKTVPLCGHKVRMACGEEATKKLCWGACTIRLSCGHKCAKLCMQSCCDEDCEELTELSLPLPCGHSGALVPCNIRSGGVVADKEQLVQYCSAPCPSRASNPPQPLKCGHVCSGSCGQCLQGRIHKVCDEDCNNTLICGHSCPVPCRQVCPPCQKPCENRCTHTKCPKKCGEPCIPCREPCGYRCDHSRCKKQCGELCDRRPCTEPCSKLLACEHDCVGFCGEPCPPCKQCFPEHYEEFFFTGDETEEDAKWILLNDCKHVIESRCLENWLGVEQEGSEIKMKTCPKCRPTEANRFIVTTQRYLNSVKQTFLDIQAVKKKVFGHVDDIRKERESLYTKVTAISPTQMSGFENYKAEKSALYVLYKRLVKDLPPVSKDRRKPMDIEELRVLAYMQGFLERLLNQKEIVWEKLNEDTRTKWLSRINVLTKSLRLREKKISAEEMESFDLEVNRIIRLSDLLVLESSGEFRELKTRQEVIDCFKRAEDLVNRTTRYTSGHDSGVYLAIEELKKIIKSSAKLSPQEMKAIHQAMAVNFFGGATAQGHWFKCPNGHIYCITECGGATVKATCPVDKCGALIGGEHHRYVDNIRLAPEMDGASRPAWSSGNDMGNYRF